MLYMKRSPLRFRQLVPGKSIERIPPFFQFRYVPTLGLPWGEFGQMGGVGAVQAYALEKQKSGDRVSAFLLGNTFKPVYPLGG